MYFRHTYYARLYLAFGISRKAMFNLTNCKELDPPSYLRIKPALARKKAFIARELVFLYSFINVLRVRSDQERI